MSLKERLRNKEIIFGTFVKLKSPNIVEMLGYAGLDFIILDMEHSNINFTEAESLIRAADLVNMSTIVRVPFAQEDNVLHALDLGAQGVQIPGLQTANEVEEIIKCGKYYPVGNRGLSYAQRAAKYGFVDKDAYLKEQNEQSLFVIHIENKEMVEEIENICSNPLVDVIFIGPMDLSQSYGMPGNIDSEIVQMAMKKIIETAKIHNKSIGIFVTNQNDLEKYIVWGIQYIVWSSDIGFCTSGVKSFLKIAKEIK